MEKLLLVAGIGGLLVLAKYRADHEQKIKKVMQDEQLDAASEFAPELPAAKAETGTKVPQPTTKAAKRAAFLKKSRNPRKDAGTEHFKLAEMVCRDGTAVPEAYRGNTQKLFEQFEIIRAEVIRAGYGPSININSGYRTPVYNDRIGGELLSRHTVGAAADSRVLGKVMPLKQYCQLIVRLINEKKIIDGGVGYYPNKGFVHYDVLGAGRRWTESRKVSFPQ